MAEISTKKESKKMRFTFDDVIHAMRQFNIHKIYLKPKLTYTIELYQNNKKDIFFVVLFIGVCDPKKTRHKLLQGKHVRREKCNKEELFVNRRKIVLKISFLDDAFS